MISIFAALAVRGGTKNECCGDRSKGQKVTQREAFAGRDRLRYGGRDAAAGSLCGRRP